MIPYAFCKDLGNTGLTGIICLFKNPKTFFSPACHRYLTSSISTRVLGSTISKITYKYMRLKTSGYFLMKSDLLVGLLRVCLNMVTGERITHCWHHGKETHSRAHFPPLEGFYLELIDISCNYITLAQTNHSAILLSQTEKDNSTLKGENWKYARQW